MSILEKNFFNILFKHEGGYVNDPRDSGGETNFGITLAVARECGYTGAMKDLTRSQAEDIYRQKFLIPIKFDAICIYSWRVAYEVADSAVNMGVGRAAEFLQKSLNAFNNGGSFWPDLKVDGSIGNATLNALEAYFNRRKDEKVLLTALNCLQGAFYLDLAERRQKDEAFVFGWIKNRVLMEI